MHRKQRPLHAIQPMNNRTTTPLAGTHSIVLVGRFPTTNVCTTFAPMRWSHTAAENAGLAPFTFSFSIQSSGRNDRLAMHLYTNIWFAWSHTGHSLVQFSIRKAYALYPVIAFYFLHSPKGASEKKKNLKSFSPSKVRTRWTIFFFRSL